MSLKNIIDDIDLDNISYVKTKKNLIHIKYNNQKLYTQTPLLYCYDNIEKVENNSYVSHQLICSTNEENNNNYTKSFFDKLDEKIIADAKLHMEEWGLTVNSEFKYTIINVNDENYNCGLKLKYLKKSQYQTKVYDENRKYISPEDYVDKFNLLNFPYGVKNIIEIVAIWIKNDVFGLYLRLRQQQVVNIDKNLNFEVFSFYDEYDKEEEQMYLDTEMF